MKHILETAQSGQHSNTTPDSRYAEISKAAINTNTSAYAQKSSTALKKITHSTDRELNRTDIIRASEANKEMPEPEYTTSGFDLRKKRLPSGFGSIRCLGKGRKNNYAVHPPMKMNSNSKWIRLCSVK